MSVPGTVCSLSLLFFFYLIFFFKHLILLLIETRQEGSLRRKKIGLEHIQSI